MMGKEQDTYRAAFIYMGTCLPRTSVLHWSTKRGPQLSQGRGVCRLGLQQPPDFFAQTLLQGCPP